MEHERLTLREWRQRRGLSQQELAEAASTTQNTVSRVELEDVAPQGRTLRRLAAALGVEPWQIIVRHLPPRRRRARGSEQAEDEQRAAA